MSLSEVKAQVRSVLNSTANRLTILQLEKDFREFIGYGIPYGKLGYPSAEQLFRSWPDFKVVGYGTHAYVECRANHIQEFLQDQGPAKTKSHGRMRNGKGSRRRCNPTIKHVPENCSSSDWESELVKELSNCKLRDCIDVKREAQPSVEYPNATLHQDNRNNVMNHKGHNHDYDYSKPNTSYDQNDNRQRNSNDAIVHRSQNGNRQQNINAATCNQQNSNSQRNTNEAARRYQNDNLRLSQSNYHQNGNHHNGYDASKINISETASYQQNGKRQRNTNEAQRNYENDYRQRSQPTPLMQDVQFPDVSNVPGLIAKRKNRSLKSEDEAVPLRAITSSIQRMQGGVPDDISEIAQNLTNSEQHMRIPACTLYEKSKPGDILPITITQIFNPLIFFFHLLEKDHPLTKLTKSMHRIYEKPDANDLSIPHGALQQSQIYAALRDGVYYRAKLITIPDYLPKYSKVTVQFIDYGIVTQISSASLRYLDPIFIDLPIQTVRGRLANLEATERIRSTAATDYFSSLAYGRELYALVTKVDKDIPLIELHLLDISAKGKIQINRKLINAGFANFQSEDSCN